jgi:CTP synthase
MKQAKTKFIFVTGGVVSSLGKGITAASLGALMEARGFKITIVKMDPYINVDPGTMSPFQHGEVFVTDDGAETDLDLGHYERFTNAVLGRVNNFTTGQVYDSVITKERKGAYLGKTVQVIPHITDEIKSKIKAAAQGVDLAIIEIGGTVGDIESLPFLEAVRQLRGEMGPANTLFVHVTLVPYIGAASELKTKPTQHSVKTLREIGIQPDILVCRCDRPIPKDQKEKIALFCNVAPDAVVTAQDAESIYEVPLNLHEEGFDIKVCEFMDIFAHSPSMERWKKIVEKLKTPKREVTIGIVGKYVQLVESYKSLNEALIHGGIANHCKVRLKFIYSEDLQKSPMDKVLEGVDGILVPGGFGDRGIEGKVLAARYARENCLPYFGICLGMQIMVVEFARSLLGWTDSNSTEFDAATSHPVIDLMENQRGVSSKGGTMRLGAYPCKIRKNTLAYKAYKTDLISERHRHRFEVNNSYREALEQKGMLFSGTSPDGSLVEIAEIPGGAWFLGCQFHPEFKSKPFSPQPLFAAFIEACLDRKRPKKCEHPSGRRKKPAARGQRSENVEST